MKVSATSLLLSLVCISAKASDTSPVPVVRVINEVRIPLVVDVPDVYYVLSPRGVNAEVFFDASDSYDPDGDQLLFTWGGGFGPEPKASGFFGAEDAYSLQLFVSDGANIVVKKFTLVVVEPSFMVHRMGDTVWEQGAVTEKRFFPLWRMLKRAADTYESLDFDGGNHLLHAFRERLKHETSLRPEVRQALDRMAEVILNAVDPGNHYQYRR